ncbi:AraC family transcriptional regulator [Streptomyces sp. UNOC14_S4]|uniref:AraC family transcriptional regulator n=1 Tax=Streptomyces sp. UNOC14_S4 TaxID=2872340 RepID=UPI001E5CF05F|nr:AraC family transcriptional regulator [Streptomyces sp. UNOC14_S4]MCC3767360.1 AraC family transcriptional regulator [Streptomyces sp. UNOC14_S4]
MADHDETVFFRGGDISALHALVGAEFSPYRLRVTGSCPRAEGSFRRLGRGALSVYELGYGVDADVLPGELPDFYHVHIPLAEHGVLTVDGKEPDSPLSVVGPGQRLVMSWRGDSLNQIVHVPRRTVDRAVAVRLGEPPASVVRFDPSLREENAPVRAWLSVVRAYVEGAEGGLLSASPLAQGHFEQLLVHGLLDTQPHTLGGALRESAAVPPAAVRRAVVFCDEHAHEPISVADIAQAARVSLRALRSGFRAHLGTTPLGHLRRVRLTRAHDDLRAAALGDTAESVTDIALRWGFTHLGRFAQAYRDAYGRTPSQTLRGEG